jgi:hypothetical protein
VDQDFSSCKTYLAALLIYFVLDRRGIGSDVFFLEKLQEWYSKLVEFFGFSKSDKYLEIVSKLLQVIIISSYFYDDRVDLPSTYGIRQQAVSVISSSDLL